MRASWTGLTRARPFGGGGAGDGGAFGFPRGEGRPPGRRRRQPRARAGAPLSRQGSFASPISAPPIAGTAPGHAWWDGASIAQPGGREAIDYIAKKPSIRDVLISGGDPLTLPDERLDWLLSIFAGFPTSRCCESERRPRRCCRSESRRHLSGCSAAIIRCG